MSSQLYCNHELDFNSNDNDNDSFQNYKWRVKLYDLNGDGQWDDKGTGFVSIIKDVY